MKTLQDSLKAITAALLLSSIALISYSQSGLIGQWHLDGNTNDASGFGHNGTIAGTVTQTAGRCGNAYHFNGSSYIDCGNVDLNSTGEFSISVWVKSTDPYVTEVWRMVVSKLDGSAGGPLELFLGDGRSPNLPGSAGNYHAWNGGLGVYNVYSAYDLSKNAKDGAWHHLAVTFKSGSQIVYFDGVQVASGTSTNPLPNTTSNFRIGGMDFGPYHHPWIGDIDEVSAYNRALSPSEIQTLAVGCGSSQSGPIGLWHLDGNTTDASGFGHNGAIVGTVTQTAGRCGGNAYHFDGNSYINCGNVDLNSTGEFSISAWVKSTDPYVTEVWRMVVSKLNSSTGGPLELFLGDGRSSGLPGSAGNYHAWNGGLGLYNVYSAYDLTRNAKDGAWHHLAVTFKSGSQIVYFDGIQVASGNSTNPLPNTTSNFHIGGINFGPYHHPWIGDIDEVAAYNRALSASEIQTLAQGCGTCTNATNLTTTNITSSSAKLNWTASVSPVQWQVQYRKAIAGATWTNRTLAGSARSVTISSLTPNQKYNWHIRAKCGTTWTAYSATANFRTASASICNGLPSNLSQNLVAYYPFCGNANDKSGNNNNPTFNNATLTMDRFGNVNSAYNFNGSQYIKGSSNNFPTANLTISIWFKMTDLSRHHVPLAYGGGTCGTSLLTILNHGTVPNSYTTTSHCEVNNCVTTDNYPTSSVWNNWIITSGSGVTKFYLNGALFHTCNNVDYSGINVTGKNFSIGVSVNPQGFAPYTDGTLDYFTGALDDIVVYNTVLSDAQVQQLYQFFNGGISTAQTAVTSNSSISNPKFDIATDKLSLYPNPSKGNITITNNSTIAGSAVIKVYDMLGRIVFNTREQAIKGNNTYHYNLSNLSPGIYYFELSTNETKNRTKFVIER